MEKATRVSEYIEMLGMGAAAAAQRRRRQRRAVMLPPPPLSNNAAHSSSPLYSIIDTLDLGSSDVLVSVAAAGACPCKLCIDACGTDDADVGDGDGSAALPSAAVCSAPRGSSDATTAAATHDLHAGGVGWLPGAALLAGAAPGGRMRVAATCSCGGADGAILDAGNAAPACSRAADNAPTAAVLLTIARGADGCPRGSEELAPFEVAHGGDGSDTSKLHGGGAINMSSSSSSSSSSSAARLVAYLLELPAAAAANPVAAAAAGAESQRVLAVAAADGDDGSGNSTEDGRFLLWRRVAPAPPHGDLPAPEAPPRLWLWVGRVALSVGTAAACALALQR